MEHEKPSCDQGKKAKQDSDEPALHTWLPTFLSNNYFVRCARHPSMEKSGCNVFCIECGGAALCRECVATRHSGHNVLTVRKVSRKFAIVVEDLQAAAPGLILRDVVDNYRANGYDHCYLSPKLQDQRWDVLPVPVPQAGPHDSCAAACNVPKQARDCTFCSLSCKLVKLGLTSLGVPRPRNLAPVPRSQGVPRSLQFSLLLPESGWGKLKLRSEGGARSELPKVVKNPKEEDIDPDRAVRRAAVPGVLVIREDAGQGQQRNTRSATAAAGSSDPKEKGKGKVDEQQEEGERNSRNGASHLERLAMGETAADEYKLLTYKKRPRR